MIITALTIIARVTVLLAVAAVLTTILRRSSASTRHLVWTCALAGSLAVPVVSLVVPAWELPLLSAPAASRVTAVEAPIPQRAAPPPLGHPGAAATRPEARKRPGEGPVSPAVTGQSRFRAVATLPSVALIGWIAGASLILLQLAIGTARMWWIARRARRVRPGGWLRFAERLAGALGVKRRVVFLEGGAIAMPMTWGVLTARVLLPRTASDWPLGRQRVVLLHELAHVKRRDCLTQLLAQVACAVYWFNPLAWFAARRLRIERERACDDLVLAAGTRGSEYADHLLEVARSMRSAMLPTWAAVAMAHRSQLEGRLMAILDPRLPRRFPTRRRSAALVVGMGLLAIPIAVITPTTKAAATALPAQTADAQRSPLIGFSPLPVPARQPLAPPVVKPDSASGNARSEFAEAISEAVKDAVPDATRDLAGERWLGPVVDQTLRAFGDAVGQAVGTGPVGGIAGGVTGGVKGGQTGGIGAGVQTETETETETEADRGRRDPRAVAALIEALKDTDQGVRESAMQALAGMRAPEAIDAIRASLKDSNPSVRERAVFALGQYRDRASTDALAVALQDGSADVREQAAFALGQIRDPRSAAPLARALEDADASVREQAAFALGQLRSAEAVEPLGRSLRDRSADVREQAAFALGQIRDRRAVEPLVASLKDASADVREQAAFALGQIGDPRGVDGLTSALKDPNAEVRRQAAFALGQIAK